MKNATLVCCMIKLIARILYGFDFRLQSERATSPRSLQISFSVGLVRLRMQINSSRAILLLLKATGSRTQLI